jgi:putative heme iron utilization protein
MLDKPFSCRSFLHKIDTGVLSTQMEHEGEVYPYGSICPYVLTPGGEIIILISEIAAHTKNINSNQNVSFTVYDQDAENKQRSSRCSILSKATVVGDESESSMAVELYTKFFPESKKYFEAHDFNFYKLSAERVRYIQGFGKINWIEGSDFKAVIPKWWDNKQYIIDHMNNDHQSALNKYRDQILEVKGEVSLFDVSVEGFHLKVDEKIHYISFSKPCLEENSVREEFIWLLRSLD